MGKCLDGLEQAPVLRITGQYLRRRRVARVYLERAESEITVQLATDRYEGRDSCGVEERPEMTLNDLHNLLCQLSVGQTCSLPYSVYELLLPPGEPDDGARSRAFQFARAHGCVIQNKPQTQEVVLTKQITNPSCCVTPEPH